MNERLTRPQTIQELQRTCSESAKRFKFSELTKNYIQSEEWKDKSQNRVWELLSRISDDIGAVLADDIVNYTRNVVDVNTCKVPQLLEHASSLSYGLDHLKNSYGFFPSQIQLLIDIFSVNPEYLIGNDKNHILSDEVIKEILVYIRDNVDDKSRLVGSDAFDTLIDDPHALIDSDAYRKFVQTLFRTTISQALSAPYHQHTDSDPGDTIPIAFNVLWKERVERKNILPIVDIYKSWVDKFIWNEVEHPLNEDGLSDTLYSTIEQLKSQKRISPKFNPFKIADHIWFNGLNPNNGLTQDEMGLVQDVLDYHARPMYDYGSQKFSSDMSTQYAYYRELEWCEWVKMTMFVMNNIGSFSLSGLSYDPSSNKFVQTYKDEDNCMKVMQIFSDGESLVEDEAGNVVVNSDVLDSVSGFLCDFVFHLQEVRENLKTIAQKHAMRGTGALLVHIVNDYLMKELPKTRDMMAESFDGDAPRFEWEIEQQFRNHGNVKVLEYMDDNEYFNIDPEADVRFTERTNERYWERLEGMGMDDSLGVLTKRQIRDFYTDVLGMGRLQPKQPKDYDYIQEFLVDLFRIGANPIRKDDEYGLYNPIDDIIQKSEEDYGYTKQERMNVQTNTQLRRNQERQFLEYSGDHSLVGRSIYDYVNNRIFYWKNVDYSSHVLHPFMYNLKLWNRLDNIIVNGYKDYVNSDLVDYLSSRVKFDDLFGKMGETRNFWKWNIMDLTGYTTRYEAAVKDERRDDLNSTPSPLTGYDGLFFPDAVKEYVDCLDGSDDVSLSERFFSGRMSEEDSPSRFVDAIYSIYWQRLESLIDGGESFYLRWYSHLNYTRVEYQRIAMQLWYWRDRIRDAATVEHPIREYCLDVQGNSMILLQTMEMSEDDSSNPYLVDLEISQNKVDSEYCHNENLHVPFCEHVLDIPSELWIRWKSNPIAVPAFDAWYDRSGEDEQFDLHYRSSERMVEMGQIMHTNSTCNDLFKVVLRKWMSEYGRMDCYGNTLPVFFDMEQSANVLALSSWYKMDDVDDDGIRRMDEYGNPVTVSACARNPLHILSIERPSEVLSEYGLEEYANNDEVNVSGKTMKHWLFDAYHYCQANGSILLPFYNFDCRDDGKQILNVRMLLVPAQELKAKNHAADRRIVQLEDFSIDLNSDLPFGGPVKVCRNTNLAFSPYDENGMNKVKMAFLGAYDIPFHGSGFKVSSTGAKTRYELDSQKPEDLGLVKGRHHLGEEHDWTQEEDKFIPETRRYLDDEVKEAFNSYDSLDKHVMVVDIHQSIDQKSLFDLGWRQNTTYSAFNVLGDAGCIPHFAYQSLVKYDSKDRDAGTAYTFRNKYLKTKSHLQFELLGLDDKSIPQAFETMQKMVVQDLEDDCRTLLAPARMMEDIYRIWCENRTFKARSSDPYDSYFDNEWREYVNPEFTYEKDENGEYKDFYEWNISDEYPDPSDLIQFEVKEGMSEEEIYALLEDYWVYVFRAEDGDILNERRYILPPTRLTDAILNVDDEEGFRKCNLSQWQTSYVQGNHYVPAQVLFVGTPDPFSFDERGERVRPKTEELQKGNGICGVDSIHLKIEVIDSNEVVQEWDDDFHRRYKRDEHGQLILDENNKPIPVTRIVHYKRLNPVIRFGRVHAEQEDGLTRMIGAKHTTVEHGQVKVAISHKNIDNIAKYHILNRSSSLYFNGSLPKNEKNQFKFSDFKYSRTVALEQNKDGTWSSKDTKDDGVTPVLTFSIDDIQTQEDDRPPYFLMDEDGNPTWYLEQSRWTMRNREWREQQEDQLNVPQDGKWHELKKGEKWKSPDCEEEFCDVHVVQRDNGVMRPVQSKHAGGFIRAHQVKGRAERYLDYLYVANGGLSFKVSEESQSFSDAMSRIPPFYVDEATKNKLADLQDVQMMDEYSTFVHQSENPSLVAGCQTFNPLLVDSMLKFGVKRTSGEGGKMIHVSGDDSVLIELDNTSSATSMRLQLEDGEVDDFLKIYTNYVRVEDGFGDWHYDLYFNVQNLFNSPFEYISTVTGQPNVLILPDSYLRLSGDKWKRTYDSNGEWNGNEIDDDKMQKLKEGGTLSIYGQAKTYSNGQLSDVKTIRLFTYQIYNISDDKPKFLINKTFDITRTAIQGVKMDKTITIEFSDVLVEVDSSDFHSSIDTLERLNNDIYLVQPVKIWGCDWAADDDSRIRTLSFDVVSDELSFDFVPELCGYEDQRRPLKKDKDGHAHYDRWSDRHMKISDNTSSGMKNITLTFEGSGYNFETIWLRWKMPRAFRIMDTIDRLGGYAFAAKAKNVVATMHNTLVAPEIKTRIGHVVVRMKKKGDMYLGMEHSASQRKNGYVLMGLSQAVENAIKESEIKKKAKETI